MFNLHALASSIIPQQTLTIERFKKNTVNDLGVSIPEFYPAEKFSGSIQPMSAEDAQVLGVTIRAEYVTLHTSARISLADSGTQPDRIFYEGREFEPVSVEDWKMQSGWVKVNMVKK